MLGLDELGLPPDGASLGDQVSPSTTSSTRAVWPSTPSNVLGSAFWWLLLSSGVGLFRSRVTPAWMRFVNCLSGAVILGFGLYALAGVLFQSYP